MKVEPVWNNEAPQKESAAVECGASKMLAERTGQQPAALESRVSRPDAATSTTAHDSTRPKQAHCDGRVEPAWNRPRAFSPSILDRALAARMRGFTDSHVITAIATVGIAVYLLGVAMGASFVAHADLELRAELVTTKRDLVESNDRITQLDGAVDEARGHVDSLNGVVAAYSAALDAAVAAADRCSLTACECWEVETP